MFVVDSRIKGKVKGQQSADFDAFTDSILNVIQIENENNDIKRFKIRNTKKLMKKYYEWQQEILYTNQTSLDKRFFPTKYWDIWYSIEY